MRQRSPFTERQRHIYRLELPFRQPGNQLGGRGLGYLELLWREDTGAGGDIDDGILRGRDGYLPFWGDAFVDAASFVGRDVFPCGTHYCCLSEGYMFLGNKQRPGGQRRGAHAFISSGYLQERMSLGSEMIIAISHSLLRM